MFFLQFLIDYYLNVKTRAKMSLCNTDLFATPVKLINYTIDYAYCCKKVG